MRGLHDLMRGFMCLTLWMCKSQVTILSSLKGGLRLVYSTHSGTFVHMIGIVSMTLGRIRAYT
jgi:hypothetical protein